MYGNWSGEGALCSAGILGIVAGETPGCVNVAGLNILRNCLFLSVTLPLPSTLILY